MHRSLRLCVFPFLAFLVGGLRVFKMLINPRYFPNHEAAPHWKGKSVSDDEFHEVREEFDEAGERAGFEEEVEEESGSEEEVSSVAALRQMVKAERRRANAALRDLDKERMAAASAAEEAMSMIFRLQNEKSSLQIEASQMARSVEEKHAYDEQFVQSLHWSLLRYEEEASVMRQELDQCNRRLEVYEHDGGNALPGFASPLTPGFRVGSVS